MTSAELKLNIFRTIDKLKKSQLDELSGVISNYVQGQQGLDDWEKLSESEKKSLLNAKASIRKNGGTKHSAVMSELRKRLSNA
jgi:hypothetical protein